MMIKKLSSGKYQVDARGIDGVRRRKSFRIRKDAEEYEKQFIVGIDSTTKLEAPIDETQRTLADGIEYYSMNETIRKAVSTQRDERVWFESFFESMTAKGISKLSEIRKRHIKEFQTELINRGLASSSINRMFNSYRHFFSTMEEAEMIDPNPMRGVRNLQESPAQTLVWEDESISRVLENADGWARDYFFFLAVTGARPSEASRMEFTNIDFQKEMVRLASSKGRGGLRERWIPVNSATMEMLKRIKNERSNSMIGQFAGRLFLNSVGKPITRVTAARALKRAVEKAEMEHGPTMRGFRNRMITSLIEINQSIEATRQIVGHANIRTTQHYAQVSGNHLRQVMENLNASRDLNNTEGTGRRKRA